MYTNIKASVCINEFYSQDFTMHEGVHYGCPAGLLVFSLCMDYLEVFVESDLFTHMIATEKYVIPVAGILLPSFLFIMILCLWALIKRWYSVSWTHYPPFELKIIERSV